MSITRETEAVQQRFRRFAEVECAGYSTIYYELAMWIAQDEPLAAFISKMPDRQPNLFFASVQYLTGPESMPKTGKDLGAFVNNRADEITSLMRTRGTQTNEVGRCAVLLPALPEGPLAVVEVGASAGLCLMLDRFAYDYGVARLGDDDSPVRLRCRLLGSPPRLAMPDIVWRRGLDIQPVDLNDPSKAKWLLACVWPDHTERRRRLEAAMTMWREGAPRVDSGDLVDDLPAVLATAPPNASLVVFHSAVLPYVPAERRRKFQEVLEDFSRQRPVVWISNESAGCLPQIDALASESDTSHFRLARTLLIEGTSAPELLGTAQAHGAELRWCAS